MNVNAQSLHLFGGSSNMPSFQMEMITHLCEWRTIPLRSDENPPNDKA